MTTVAGLLAWGVGHRPAGIVSVVLAVLASQLAVGWTNDALDAERDATVGRTDKPVASGAVGRRATAWAAAVAAVACPLLALTTNPAAAFWLTLALVSALLYDWPLKATAFSVLPYAVSFGALPAFVVLALPGQPTPPVCWLRRRPAWVPARTSPTCCPTWPTTLAPACAACPTGWAPPAAGWPRRVSSSRRPRPWSSDHPGRRRPSAGRRSARPPWCRH